MSRWADILQDQLDTGLSHQRYGDLDRWQKALEALPEVTVDSVSLNNSSVGASALSALDERSGEQLREALMGLHPWRKGPYDLFGVHIDTEWRSDWKWDRLRRNIDPLSDRRVLDDA